MPTFFKATRPDATAFQVAPSGQRVHYNVGATTRIPNGQRGTILCEPGLLHASDEPGETLIGGAWPCRLFEVEGAPIAGPESHKYGFHELYVAREVDAWRALGPNGLEVAAFIDRVRALKSAAWDAARDAARAAARAAARDAARAAAWDAAWAARGTAWDAAWDAARAAARDAALALCARDLITAEQFDTLYNPWQKFIPADDLGPWDTLRLKARHTVQARR